MSIVFSKPLPIKFNPFILRSCFCSIPEKPKKLFPEKKKSLSADAQNLEENSNKNCPRQKQKQKLF